MSLTSPKFYPNGFMKNPSNTSKNYDETAEPTLEVTAGTDSTGVTVAIAGQAVNLTDNDIQSQLSVTTTGGAASDVFDLDMALTTRDEYDFAFLGLHNIRDAYPAAVNQQIDFLHDTDGAVAGATNVSPASMVSGLLGRPRPLQRYDGVSAKTRVDALAAGFNTVAGSIVFAGLRVKGITTGDFTTNTDALAGMWVNNSNFWQLLIGSTGVGGTTNEVLSLDIVAGASEKVYYTQDQTILDGEEHDVVITLDDTTCIMYVDGVAVTMQTPAGSNSHSGFNLGTDMTAGVVGARHHNGADSVFFEGDIGAHLWYNRVLSSSETLGHTDNPELYPLAIDQWGTQTEILDETDFATNAKWDVTGEADDTGGNCTWTFAGGSLNGTLTQTAANRVSTGANSKKFRFTYTYSEATGPDGDEVLSITNAFAESAVNLPMTVGTHSVEFTSASGATAADFVIDLTETTATKGVFSIDDVSLTLLGAVAAYQDDGINPDDGKWYDSSTNSLDGTNTAIVYIDTPTDTAYDFTLAEFAAASDSFWFATINTDGLAAGEAVKIGQWMMGKTFTPSFNPDLNYTEEVGADGVVLSRTQGGRFIGNRRHGAKLRWTFKWSWLTDAEKILFNDYYDTVGGKLFPHLFSPNSADAEPIYYMVRLMSGNPFVGMASNAHGLTMVLEED